MVAAERLLARDVWAKRPCVGSREHMQKLKDNHYTIKTLATMNGAHTPNRRFARNILAPGPIWRGDRGCCCSSLQRSLDAQQATGSGPENAPPQQVRSVATAAGAGRRRRAARRGTRETQDYIMHVVVEIIRNVLDRNILILVFA
jgi:hypothetical protein